MEVWLVDVTRDGVLKEKDLQTRLMVLNIQRLVRQTDIVLNEIALSPNESLNILYLGNDFAREKDWKKLIIGFH